MTSKTKHGRQEPTFTTVNTESWDFTYGPAIADFYKCYKIELLPSQQLELDAYGARTYAEDGTELIRYNTVCTARPRQTGKSYAVRLYALFLAVFFGKRILVTCHNTDTTKEHFKWLKGLIESHNSLEEKLLPDGVKRSYIEMGFYFRNGGSIEFSTRTNSLSRGKTYDIIIIDEAQEYTYGQMESLSAVTIASGADSQTIYLGTPPSPLSLGTVFRDLYEQAHSGKSSIGWMEWAIGFVPTASEITDPDLWYAFNPGMGFRITEKKMRDAAESFANNPVGFAREYLGYWSPIKTINPIIDAEQWNTCSVSESVADAIKGDLAFGVKISASGTFAALTIAVRPFDSDQPKLVELYDVLNLQVSSVAEFADFLAPLLPKTLGVLIDGKGDSATLVYFLAKHGVKDKRVVIQTKTDTLTNACSMFLNGIRGKSIAHCGYSELTDGVTSSTKRMIGKSGAFGFASDGPEATIAESAALAFYLASTSKRKPGKKAKAVF